VHIDRFTFEASIKAVGQELLFWPVADLMHLFVFAEMTVLRNTAHKDCELIMLIWSSSGG
jgi:hypothetical protein